MHKPLAALSLAVAVAACSGLSAAAHTSSSTADAPDEKGTVTAISATNLSLRTQKGNAKTFRLTARTTVERLDAPATLAEVRPGAIVKVEYTSTSGEMTATSITVGVATSAGWLFSSKATGTITGVFSDWLRIEKDSGRIIGFRFTPSTRFERLGKKISVGELAAGARAKVKFELPSNPLTARRVTVGVNTASGVLYDDKEEGRVTALGAGSLSIDPGGGKKPLTFHLTARTRYENVGRAARRSAVRAGAVVKVKFAVAADRTLDALSVSVGAASAIGVVYSTKRTGFVAALSARRLRLRTQKGDRIDFRLTPRTTFEKAGLRAKRVDVHAGEAVRVRFQIAADRALVARSVKVGTVVAGKLSFPKKAKGTVRAVSAARLLLRTSKGKLLVFRLTRKTVYEKAGRRAGRAVVRVGRAARVKYQKLGGSAKLALVVRVV